MADLKGHWWKRALDPFSGKTRKSQQQIFSPILWVPLLFLLMGLGASGKETPPRVISGILGGSVTFLLNISINAKIEFITWTYPPKTLALAVANSSIMILDKEYSGRLNVSKDGYSLHMSNLTKNDSGSYQAQISQKNVLHNMRNEFILHIYEPLQEPQVTVKSVTSSENDSCTVTLICTVSGSKDGVQYSWIQKDTHFKTSQESHILRVSQSACDPDLPYTCTARNPVSQNSSQPVRVWQFCTGASRKNTTGKTVVGILGEPVTLSLELPANQDTENVVWVFNTSVISQEAKGTATVDPRGRKPKSSEERRVRISDQDSSLKISQLQMEDTGHYHAYVCSETSRGPSVRHFNLLVYQRLKKPNVTQSPVHMTNGICKVVLTCSVESGGKDVRYTWMPLERKAVMSQGKSHLNVSWKSGERLPNFTCTTHNPVSNSSGELSSRTLCSGPGRNKRLWILLLLGLFLGMLIGGCFILKKRKLCKGSSLAIRYSQARVPAEIPETPAGHIGFSVLSQQYEKLDMPAKTTRHHPTPTSDTSSESSATTEEDDEKTRMYSTVNHRNEVCDLFTQEDITHDLAEYEAVTPDDKVAKSMDEEDTAYIQVSLNVRGENPLPQKKEDSNTIYCSVQKRKTGENPLPQKKEDSNTIYCSVQKCKTMVQTPQQDPESSQTPTYENFS